MNKISKKNITILTAILVTVLLLSSLFIYFGKKKNQYNERQDLPYIENIYMKMYSYESKCINASSRIAKLLNNNYSEESLSSVAKLCKETSNQIKNIQIPTNLPKKSKEIIKRSRKKLSKVCYLSAVSFEYLIKTNGDLDGYHNENAKNAWKTHQESYELHKSVQKDVVILKNLYKSEGDK